MASCSARNIRYWGLRCYPRWATSLGDHRFDDQLTDPSAEARKAWQDQQDGFLAEATALDEASLNEADRLTRALFIEGLTYDAQGRVCREWHWSVSPRYNPYPSASDLHESLPVTTPERAAAQLLSVQVPCRVALSWHCLARLMLLGVLLTSKSNTEDLE